MNAKKKQSDNKKDNGGDFSEDIVLEEEDSELVEGVSKEKIKQLRDKLRESEKERGEFLAGWQRSKADLVNFRRKTDEEKKSLITSAEKDLVEELLPALESFEMAFKDKDTWESVPANWRNGVEYIYNQIWETLASRGLEKIEPEKGEEFDPNIHESVQNISVSEKEKDNKIDSVIRAGYKFKEKVVRPAKVCVNHFE